MNSKRKSILTALALGALAVAGHAGAAGYPDKTVNYIIPFGPGGESDITARMQQPFFKTITGQELVIQYKPGGGGAVGWSQLNSSAGDGYTIMGINLPHIVIQPAQKDVGYTTDDIKAFYMRLNEDEKTVAAMDVLAPGIGEIIGGSQREERLDVLDARMDEHLKRELWWYRDLRRYGTVPHAGFGLGFERLLNYVTGMENVRDAIPFPRTPGHASF